MSSVIQQRYQLLLGFSVKRVYRCFV